MAGRREFVFAKGLRTFKTNIDGNLRNLIPTIKEKGQFSDHYIDD